jgi:hypothetical protein
MRDCSSAGSAESKIPSVRPMGGSLALEAFACISESSSALVELGEIVALRGTVVSALGTTCSGTYFPFGPLPTACCSACSPSLRSSEHGTRCETELPSPYPLRLDCLRL